MKNLFSILASDFFKPLNSKYKDQYADCLLTIYNSYKREISYFSRRLYGRHLGASGGI